MAQKTYKEQLMELYGNGQTGTSAQTTPTAQQQSNAMLELILNRKPYSYDPKTDPAAQAARKQTARDARAVTQNTLGQYAAMTGGMPSTAAVSAAAQAGNQAVAQGAERIAELERLAYSRYQQEGQNMNSMLALLQQQAGDEYNRGRDALADKRYEEERDYNRGRDAVADERYTEERDYSREQDAYNRQWNEKQEEYERKYNEAVLAAQYGDTSKLKALGIDVSNYGSGSGGSYRGSGGGSGGGSGSGGSNSGGAGSGLPDAVYNDLLIAHGKNLPPDVYAQYAAKYGEDALKARGFTRKRGGGGSNNPTLPRPNQPDTPSLW